LAEIYIFAHHSDQNVDTADHWCAQQWEFRVVSESNLPEDRQSISILDVDRLAEPVSLEALAAEVQRLAAVTSPNRRTERATELPAEAGDLDETPGGSF
jgi:hypothetical protein